MKGKLKKALIIILVIVGILALTVIGLGIYFIATKPKADISEIPQNLGLSVILSDVVSASSEDGENLHWYAALDEAETRSLTFAGQEVDGVEEVNYFATPYYFWHITLPDVGERLQDIDYGSYTCQELIDALGVQYEKAE